MLWVAAAGNSGTDPIAWSSYPGSYPQVMSVAAVDCAKEVGGGLRSSGVGSSDRRQVVPRAAPHEPRQGQRALMGKPRQQQELAQAAGPGCQLGARGCSARGVMWSSRSSREGAF
jgi:hypothetical protein